MDYFDHEKLHVYQAAKEFLIITETIIKRFPKGRAYLIDQLQRAACSVMLNIAEGSGEFSPGGVAANRRNFRTIFEQ